MMLLNSQAIAAVDDKQKTPESRWSSCGDPDWMLDALLTANQGWKALLAGWTGWLRGKPLDRQQQLYACACCRRIWHLLKDDRSRHAVEVGERLADGLTSARELRRARQGAKAAAAQLEKSDQPGLWAAGAAVAAATCQTWAPRVAGWSAVAARHHEEWQADAERQAQCDLLRDIFGNPFCPTLTNPLQLKRDDGRVLTLARGIYDHRRFREMPILAELLERAGCVDSEILAHCRSSGNHTRGCWVLDRLLRE